MPYRSTYERLKRVATSKSTYERLDVEEDDVALGVALIRPQALHHQRRGIGRADEAWVVCGAQRRRRLLEHVLGLLYVTRHQ